MKFGITHLIGIAGLLLAGQAFALGTGVTSYPLKMRGKALSAEFAGITSSGGGMGVQGRYSYQMSKKVMLDAGLGLNGGERTSRFFVGADYEIFPDYVKQPRFSLKGKLENAKEFGIRKNKFGVAPTLSKGYKMWGTTGYPFLSLPYAVELDSDNNTFGTSLSANLGVTMNLPWKDYRDWIGSFEGQIGLKDSFTGVIAGLTFPME